MRSILAAAVALSLSACASGAPTDPTTGGPELAEPMPPDAGQDAATDALDAAPHAPDASALAAACNPHCYRQPESAAVCNDLYTGKVCPNPCPGPPLLDGGAPLAGYLGCRQ